MSIFDSFDSDKELEVELKENSDMSSLNIDLNGSCDGLLLLCQYDHDSGIENIWLVNSSTEECKTIPKPPSTRIVCEADYIHYGFGYTTDQNSCMDYKIVRIRSCYVTKEYAIPWEVTIYSLRNNSWKTVPSTGDAKHAPFIKRALSGPVPDSVEGGFFAKGALHWEATNVPYHWGGDDEEEEEYRCMVAFDIEKESFRELPYPLHKKCMAAFQCAIQRMGAFCCCIELEDDE
ncbi:hypothetical protein AQUCO_07800004v1 [Aquilegia coerulea]|uniref:F-box associated beta-propeller type 1 domain-containing protein n=1 Tax=Aquilegia coerulea TaxID=218851 RepID=A0A2G5C7V8_AQUCA|nr:hypothetical protein AQUCO_07800004v1 [Aquilegia coerulea]